KPLRSIIHGDPSLKIYTASIAPGGLRVAGEVADANLPFFMSPERAEAIIGPTLEGRARAKQKGAGRSTDLADFDNAPYVRVSMGDDLAKCRDALRPGLALYIGGMGARSRNFYNDLTKRIGYEAAAVKIQDLYLDGKKTEAAAAVPDALIDEISLIGPPARMRGRQRARRGRARRGSRRGRRRRPRRGYWRRLWRDRRHRNRCRQCAECRRLHPAAVQRLLLSVHAAAQRSAAGLRGAAAGLRLAARLLSLIRPRANRR